MVQKTLAEGALLVGPQFSVERRILSSAAAFARLCGIFCVFTEYCGIRHWPEIRGQIRRILVGSGGLRKLVTVCIHDFTMKYTTAPWAVTGGMLKILI